jgi:ribonuclease D
LQKRVRDHCADLGINPSIIASRADLEAVMLGRRGRLTSGWRRELLAGTLDDLL